MAEGGEAKPEIVDESETMIAKMAELNIKPSTPHFLSISEVDILNILRGLDISDLINVAQTNRRLKQCADAIILSCHETLLNDLVISSPNEKFFRQFGHLARELKVKCSKITTDDWLNKKLHILPVVADRCQGNLQTLKLEQVCEDLSTLKKVDQAKVRKLFTGLKKLHIVDCYLNEWDKVMKSAETNIEILLLQFDKMDSWQGYVRKYRKLKTLYMVGFFSTELLDVNSSMHSLTLHADSISKNHIKSIGGQQNLKSVTINISGPKRGCEVIASDFRPLAEIPNLEYLYLMTGCRYPMKTRAYIATLLALQKHEKLTELHFFSHFFDPITNTAATQFEEKAFPKLKQLGIYGDFPFISAVSKFRSIVDVFIMESLKFHIKEFEPYRSLIVSMPKLQRLFIDVSIDIDEKCRESLVQMCQSRTSKSKLLVLIQNFKNNIVRTSMYPKTVLMFSVSQPNMPTDPFIFDESVVNAFDRAMLLAQRGGYVAVNYLDFAKIDRG